VERIYKVAVLGAVGVPACSPIHEKAVVIGQAVASRGAILLTGGCPGLPHAAVLGARSMGGLTLAISPAMNRDEHAKVYGYPLDSNVIVFTGMGTKGRNVVLVRSADACIFVGGGMGTLNEFTIAFDDLGPKNALGVLSGSEGFSEDLPRLASKVHGRDRSWLVVESDPQALVHKLLDHVSMASEHCACST
jgi:uncharacterized protein (TIGR00725 family)